MIEGLTQALHGGLIRMVDVCILLFELFGVLVVAAAGLRGAVHYVRHDPLTRLNLAKGLATGLEFKLGSEILRTVVVREFSEIFTVAGIIVLRAALTVLIHWEIRNEEPGGHATQPPEPRKKDQAKS